ncbi:MAG: transglutaminase-like domain-containing protein [Odoribacter sp.]|nr:transglutaminase-like domain-containing protein [Odoribacter sp.]
MIKRLLMTIATTGALCASASTPLWLEDNASEAISRRISTDFPYTVEQFTTMAAAHDSSLTPEVINEMITNKFVETMVINDTVRVFRKALRNLYHLDPMRNGGWHHRGANPGERRISYVDSVIDWHNGVNPLGGAHRVEYTFSLDVPGHEAIAGDTLRVWLPVPFESSRQSDIEILSASAPYTLSDGRSVHNTIYFEAPAPVPGDTAHFEYSAAYTAAGQYFPEEYILANLKPYDKSSDLYSRYTATEDPHIIKMPFLARAIAGDENNPYRLSERVFDFISNFPWAGAREYSTIDCIPAYVMQQGHGDCGQVSLLYISLMRTLGIPARWESGWMIHPGEKNYHDWAEVYFEGIGWVPVDTSFGRYTAAIRPETQGFYSHGMDAHRFATNHGICGALYPPKKFVRSETVDFQPGEVETSRGNLFYPAWSSHFKLNSVIPVKIEQ